MVKKARKKNSKRAKTGAEMPEVAAVVREPHEQVASSAPALQDTAQTASQMEVEEGVDPAVERRSKRPRTASNENGQLPQQDASKETETCHACQQGAIPESMELLTCTSCALCFHARCYTRSTEEVATADPVGWKCDVCRYRADSVPVEARACVYCKQPGDACMRCVDTIHWPAEYRQDVPNQSTTWAHVTCALWDPFITTLPPPSTTTSEPPCMAMAPTSVPPTVVDAAVEVSPLEDPPLKEDAQAETITKTTDSTSTRRSRLELFVPPCCFCDKDQGVRVQCRHVDCGRFFHVRCCSAGSGFVQVVHTPFPLKHAYCDRHRQCRFDLSELTAKLTSKTLASLVPRDVALKAASLAKRVDSYTSVDAVLADLASLLIDLCKKGLANSKTDPQTFSMRHLQALQLVVDHLPQLCNVYDAATLTTSNSAQLVNDTELLQALQKAFHPQRFVRKFAGPLRQHHQCDLCHEPFQERQHVFYCIPSADGPHHAPHALHWKCTKRKPSAKDAGSRQGSNSSSTNKKKLRSVALVQQGHWKEIRLPKGLPTVSDGVTCGVCRAPMDTRAILAGRKDAMRIEFEKPSSAFMFGGCFVNEMDARSAAAAGLRTSRATATATTTVVLPALATSSSSSQRASGKSAVRRNASGGGGTTELESDAPLELRPPKMERINVRRTTRWLACLGQAIRLVSVARKEAAAQKTKETQDVEDANASDKLVSTSASATMDGMDADPVHALAHGEHDGTAKRETDKCDSIANRQVEELLQEIVSTVEITVAASPAEPMREIQATIEKADAAVAIARGEANHVPDQIASTPHDATVALSSDASMDAANEQQQVLNPPPSASSSLPPLAVAYLEEAKNVVRPYDAYALHQMETAHCMLESRNGPALSVLNALIQEYTRFVYIKHTRAVAKATTEKRKRQELEAQEERERERKRVDLEAEMALKKQMLAMRKKQRQS